MTSVRTTPALLLLLACFPRTSFCAVKLKCTVRRDPEGVLYILPHVNATGCVETWLIVDDTGKETVVATHEGNWNGAANFPSCHPNEVMKFKADCDKSQGFEHYSSDCETNCSETGGSIGEPEKEGTVKNSAYYGKIAAPVILILLVVVVACVLIYIFRKHIKRSWIALRPATVTENERMGTEMTVYSPQ